MSDERLRELTRRFDESGALEDEVALLHEQVRAGVLDLERVRLAVRLGSEAARQVDPDPPLPQAEGAPWRLPEEALHEAPLLRAAWVACHVATLAWEAVFPRDPELPAALDLARRWILGPEPALAIEARRHLERAQEALEQRVTEGFELEVAPTPQLQPLQRANYCLRALNDLLAAIALAPGSDRRPHLLRAIDRSGRATHIRAVKSSLERHLLEWALGRGDPVVE
ncbi:MAG: hypothetical protein AB7N76_30105 [Planctomycetota bacterium]